MLIVLPYETVHKNVVSVSNTATDEQIMHSAKSAVNRSKFQTLIEEKANPQNLNSTPNRRVTRSQSTSPPQIAEMSITRKRKLMAKVNESIVVETVNEAEEPENAESKEVATTRQLETLEPITEIEVDNTSSEVHENVSEDSKTVVFNESIIVAESVAKTVYPKTPMHLKGAISLPKDMDISMSAANFNENFGQLESKENNLPTNADKSTDEHMDIDMSLMEKKMLTRQSSTPLLFSIKVKRLPENEKEKSELEQEESASKVESADNNGIIMN